LLRASSGASRRSTARNDGQNRHCEERSDEAIQIWNNEVDSV